MKYGESIEQVMRDPALTLEQKGLYALIAVLAAEGKSMNLSWLSRQAGCSRKKVRSHLNHLEARALLSVVASEEDSRAQIVLLTGSVEERNQNLIRQIIQRVDRVRRNRDQQVKESVGEAWMKEWLTLLIADDLFTDNARPGFLVSTLTGERLEYDRWYPRLKLAWEFHGPHHFDQADKAQLARQQTNDMMKIGLSQRAGVRLIEITAEDLRLDRILALIPDGTPLRSLDGLGEVISFLELESAKYRHAAGLKG